MYYMEKGIGSKVLAIIFSCLCIAASLGVGNMTQSNAISLATNQLWSFPYWLSGLLTALAIGLVIIGGIRRIAPVSYTHLPQDSMIRVAFAISPLASFIPAIRGCSANFLQVSSEISIPVRDGTL